MSAREKKTTTNSHPISELRQNIITGEWVVIATGRAKRPHDFQTSAPAPEPDLSNDPFDDPEGSGQEKDVLVYRTEDGDWSLRVFPNKFPAFVRDAVPEELSEGPYFAMTGAGFHEVIVTRDPRLSLALLDPLQVAEVIDAYQERYLDLMTKRSVRSIHIFHNHGESAGASLAHPHSQLMAVSVVPEHIEQELGGAEEYYRDYRKSVFATIFEEEQSVKKRLVFENEHFVVFCPFASRSAFEMWILPKRLSPYFERITDEEKIACGSALKTALQALYTGLGNPDYNFYIHTAPADGRDYPHYAWHIEIVPRTAIWAGFELSTGMEVSTIEPEVAAEFLREEVLKNENV
ncbi:MAG: galactose-1-phosphate uridylyltransferase [Candidatus Moraniibacteriota bacterium]